MTPVLPLLVAAAFVLGAERAAAQSYDAVTISGETVDNGVFDPSVEYLPDGSVGWLFYSWVGGNGVPWGPAVETHLARSDDAGATWVFQGTVNPATPGSVGSPSIDGIWNYEVASIAYDPDDAGREWKLFAHRIFRPVDPADPNLIDHLVQYSWIVHRWAPDPTGPWSAEVALFGSTLIPLSPFTTQVDVSQLDPSLNHLIAYSEPGAYYTGGVLYVSLTGLIAAGPDRIVLLASDDHGATWRYVGTPLVNADLVPLGFEQIDGTSIVEQAGRVFLLGTPKSDTLLHHGTLAFEFDDLTLGTLVEEAGVNVVRNHVPPQPALIGVGRGGGQSDFHEHNAAGMLMPQLHVAALPEIFETFATGQTPLGTSAVPALGRGALVALGALLAVLTAAAATSGRDRTTGRT